MPQFFFHVHDDSAAHDDESSEFPDVETARQAALQAARELICDEIRHGRPVVLHHHIDVDDAEGRNVLNVSFAEAFRIES